MLGLKADNIIIELEENNNTIQNAVIGIYNGHLSKNGKYKALIGLDLLDYKEEIGYDEHIRNIKV